MSTQRRINARKTARQEKFSFTMMGIGTLLLIVSIATSIPLGICLASTILAVGLFTPLAVGKLALLTSK